LARIALGVVASATWHDPVIGLYSVSREGLVTVRTPYDSKSRQLGGSSNTLIARILLRELAAEGKA